jgi:hypothetical protein
MVPIYGGTCSETMCFNVYIQEGFLAKHGGYDQELHLSHDEHIGFRATLTLT